MFAKLPPAVCRPLKAIYSKLSGYDEIAAPLGVSKRSAFKYGSNIVPGAFPEAPVSTVDGEVIIIDASKGSQQVVRAKTPPSPELKAAREAIEMVEIEVKRTRAETSLRRAQTVRDAEAAARTKKEAWSKEKISMVLYLTYPGRDVQRTFFSLAVLARFGSYL